MTMFGRDSIFTSLQALPFTPELAATTLRALGDWQGSRVDDFRDEDPGPDPARDALRRDDGVRGAAALALLRLRRRDAAVRRAARRVRALDRRPQARARARARGPGRAQLDRRVRRPPWATATSRTSGATRRPASRTSAGRTPGTRSPTATAAARVPAGDLRAAGLRLRREGARRPPGAARLEGPGARRPARAARRPTSSAASTATSGSRTASTSPSPSTPRASRSTSLASNNGHLLWSGIVDKSKAKAVAEHLMGPRLFSGWGVRTLAEGEGRYNPIGYHVGTVWPFDNSFIAWGLRRYGFKDEAAQIAAGILDAAEFFDGRLPEAFGGYERERDEVPGPVPDRVQPAGLVDGHAAAAAADDARPRAARRPPRRRPGASRRASAISSCSTSPAAGAGSTPSAAGASTSNGGGGRERRGAAETPGRPRVLVLGGGFAGIGATKKLEDADVDVVVVDKHDYHTFQPLLYQLATGLLETTAVGHSLRDLVKNQDNATIHKAPITEIDLEAKEVTFDGLAPITYDFLVLALGAAGELLRNGGRRRARVSDVHAAGRGQAQESRPRPLGGSRQGRRPRRRRSSDGRRGRRRADRRRDSGSARRALPHELRQGLPTAASGEGAHRPRRGGRRDIRDVQAEPPRIREGRARAADGRGHDRRTGEVGVADARHALLR